MDQVVRAAAVYAIVLILFRLLGKRSLAQITMFDFVILLIISEATQQALLGDDFSLTAAALVVLTLLLLSQTFDYLSVRSPRADKILNDVPLILIHDGKLKEDRLKRSGVDESEIMEAARQLQGLERLNQVKWAILERNGGITVVPKEGAAP